MIDRAETNDLTKTDQRKDRLWGKQCVVTTNKAKQNKAETKSHRRPPHARNGKRKSLVVDIKLVYSNF